MPVRAVSAVRPSTPTPASLSPKRTSIPELVAIASLLMATVALSIDIMLPALDDMARELGAAAGNDRQHVILALFAGFTLGQLVFGPLSDSIGRRPSILAGVVLYVLGSAVCASATSFETLIAGRVLQGGGAAGSADRHRRVDPRPAGGRGDGARDVAHHGIVHHGAGPGAGTRAVAAVRHAVARSVRGAVATVRDGRGVAGAASGRDARQSRAHCARGCSDRLS